jgi:hypothetical protein
MRARRRRRVDKVLIAAGIVAVGGAALAGSAGGDQERVTGLWTSAAVDDGGDAEITEVIDYDFGTLAQDRHGIFRDVPGLDPAATVEVVSETAPDDVLLQDFGSQTRIRIGDPNANVSGQHRYRIDYPLPGVAPAGLLNWNAVGTGWEVGLSDIEAHIVTPFTVTTPQCSVGTFDTQGGCEVVEVEPGHLMVMIDELEPREGVTVSGRPGEPLSVTPTVPAPPTDPPTDDGAGLARPTATAALLALAAAVPTSMLVRRAGREQHWHGGATDAAFGPPPPPGGDGGAVLVGRMDQADLHELATIEFAPPAELTPAQGGIVLTETVKNDHKVAWLIDQAVTGAIELEDDDPDKAVLHWRGGAPPADDAILRTMFDQRPTVTLGTYDKDFSAGWSSLERHLDDWRDESGYWDPAADRRRAWAIGLGIVATLLGLLLTVVGAVLVAGGTGAAFVALAIGALVAGSGLTVVVRSWELRVRTTRGTGLWLRVESFRRFIAESEGYHADWAAENGILREYTAWAVAVGEIDRWARSVAASSAAQSVDAGGVRLAAAAPLLARATTSAATAPSSSGGGGGGFGGVGGGAGGGGGGSW